MQWCPEPPESGRLSGRFQIVPGVPSGKTSWLGRQWGEPESAGAGCGRSFWERYDFRANYHPGGLSGVAAVQYNRSFLDSGSILKR